MGAIQKKRQILFALDRAEGVGKFLANPQIDFWVLHNSSKFGVNCAEELFYNPWNDIGQLKITKTNIVESRNP